MTKWQKISIICVLAIIGLVFLNYYLSPLIPERKKIITKLWGCQVDDLECLKEKTNDEEIKLTSTDNRVEVEIPKNTLKKGAKLEIKPTKRPVEKEELPTLGTFGQVYEIKNKAEYLLNQVTLKFPYNEEEIPEGVKEEDLILARWDGRQWAPVASQVDIQNNLIIVQRDKVSSYSMAYAERPQLGGTGERITVRGKFTIAGVGPLKRARFSVSQEVNGKKEWIGILSKTNEKGEFSFSVPKEMVQKLNEGKLYIMAAANNEMVVIHDKGGKTYNTSPLKLESVKGYEVTANVAQDSQDAFKIFHRYDEIRKSYLEMLSHFKNEDLKGEMRDALTNQVVVNYLLPGTNPTQFTPHVIERDAIDINVNSRNVGAMGDGDGDTEAHEYGHYMTRMLYGIFDYNRLVLSLKSKSHEIGDVTYQKLAFAEDIAYFLESIFDGKKMEDLERADPYARRKNIEELLYGSRGFATSFRDAIEKAMESPSKISELERHLQVFVRLGGQTLGNFNNFVNEYNPGLNQTPGQIDGQGANILWDIYASELFGQTHWERLEKIMTILADEEPKGLDDLYEALTDNFPGETAQIEKLFDSYAWRQEITSMPEIDWEKLAREALAKAPTGQKAKFTPEDLNKIIEAINRTIGTRIKKECVPDWKCSDWSDCLDGWQTCQCEDLNKCGTDEGKPEEGRACEEDCIPDWECSDWSECVGERYSEATMNFIKGSQTCECLDLNDCGTDIGKPPITQECCDYGECVDLGTFACNKEADKKINECVTENFNACVNACIINCPKNCDAQYSEEADRLVCYRKCGAGFCQQECSAWKAHFRSECQKQYRATLPNCVAVIKQICARECK